MIEGLLLPDVDDTSAPFWEAAGRGELVVQACADCGRLRHPPRPMCPWCQSERHDWRPVSGRGTIWSFVVVHPPLFPAYAQFAPYNVIVVALEDEPNIRMIGNLVEAAGASINSVDEATIRIGESVRVVFERVSEDVTLPRWVRAEKASTT